MKITNRWLLVACLTLPFAVACKKEEKVEQTVAAPVTRPSGNDDKAWAEYLQDVVRRNLGETTNSPYLYYLPASGSPGYEGNYERLGEQMTTDLQRGVVEGNMLAYGSPESNKMGDLVVQAFTDAKVSPGTMAGVRVLFIGDAADAARIKAVTEPTGASFELVEAK